ncbi:unnamed protein product [Prorocentrum cordatum]|uniref:Uncharacterized protein n=1 Tax=Prorocentrum cordatum TaxID=2364126 RepID=A0ABN9UVN1_9DINO|nr:unnamed protein product [Polarella glacialis]|mmetsp:Transcript_74425/g.210754  ORF Transcript_74425/g.210754 Transcript_74425/m.210754 type:complete len:122 (-) Transcript_74425:23-388(-)
MASLPFPDGDDTCVQWAQKNPKKLGSLSFERYERYKGSRTVREAKARGAIRADFENDHKKGFMKIAKRLWFRLRAPSRRLLLRSVLNQQRHRAQALHQCLRPRTLPRRPYSRPLLRRRVLN